jgi:diguanylate cyclase (GGDEF)-like protein
MWNSGTTPKDAPARRLTVLGLAITLGFISICTAIVVQMRSSDFNNAQLMATNVVSAIEADIARNIEIYDLSLQAVVENVRRPDLKHLSPELRQLLLFDRSATAKHLGPIQVINHQGQVVLDSRTATPRAADHSHTEHFRAHRDLEVNSPHISKPWRAADGEQYINISRRMTGDDGRFAGMVVGHIRLSYFLGLFEKVKLSERDVLTLALKDGTLVMRTPYHPDAIGRDLAATSVFQRVSATPSGSFVQNSGLDGTERLYVHQRIGEHPLYLTMGQSTDELLAPWRREAIRVGLVVLTLCLTNVALVIFLARELRRRQAAERGLQEIATTDALTGLGNRRRFDADFEHEWNRARRDGLPLSLLLIDADAFKAYNDTHGHQAGDRALAAIASCIGQELKRAGDFGARYGGEEFAVILAGTSLEAAHQVAETIRASVLAQRDAQGDRDDRLPTVSVGVACVTPDGALNPGDLINAADDALYEAKRAGRNCSVCASAAVKGAVGNRLAA